MSAEVRLSVVSMSARSPDGADAAYLEWHLLDHLPEQYGIPEMQHGDRWVSTPACRAVRAAADDRFAATDHVVQYLFSEPVPAALDRFFSLGAELRTAGRMPLRLPPVELGGYEVVDRSAAAQALVRPEVLPWRPHGGAYLVVERDDAGAAGPGLCEVDGVVGAWHYRGGSFDERLADTSGLVLTVCYLDGEPPAVGTRLAEALAPAADRLLFAAPFVSVTPWEWDRSLP